MTRRTSCSQVEAPSLFRRNRAAHDDGRDLFLEMRQRGFDIVRNKAELESTRWCAPRTLGIFADGDLASSRTNPAHPPSRAWPTSYAAASSSCNSTAKAISSWSMRV